MAVSFLTAYLLGGLTFIPLVIAACIAFTIYTSVPVGDLDPSKATKEALSEASADTTAPSTAPPTDPPSQKPIQGWVLARRTFEEPPAEGSYAMSVMRNFLDSRSGDPKRARPKDTFYAVLKSTVLYLYEDDTQNECFAAIGLANYEVVIWPEGTLDGELFAKRNAIMLRERPSPTPKRRKKKKGLLNVTKEMKISESEPSSESPSPVNEHSADTPTDSKENSEAAESDGTMKKPKKKKLKLVTNVELAKPWFLFIKSNTQMEDWYLSLLHASTQPSATPVLDSLLSVFSAVDMGNLVASLDSQPDPIPMRWLNALVGRIFFSMYKTSYLESYIIGRIVRKISKIKLPSFLSDITVKEVSVGNTAPMLSKPMLKELTKEGDASIEVGLAYKGEVKITVEANATINIGTFTSYTVDLVIAVVLREIEGNLLVKIKRPPSNRIWYGFTSPPKLELDVEPVVSDRQIKWGMVLNPITTQIKQAIHESIVLPNMDDIPFFESGKYEHRGGIFADASRQKDTPPITITPSVQPVIVQTSPPSPTADEVKRSQSIDVLPIAEASTSTSPPEPSNMARAESLPDTTVSRGDKTPPQQETPLPATVEVSTDGAEHESEDEGFRGRTHSPGTGSLASRSNSRSIRSMSETEPENVKLVEEEEVDRPIPGGLATESVPSSLPTSISDLRARSPSPVNTVTPLHQRSASISHASSKSLSGMDIPVSPTTASQLSKSTSSAPLSHSASTNSVTSATSTTSTTSSLFSSWKARAMEKENFTKARETMKKWGVQWTAARKGETEADDSGRESDKEVTLDMKKKSYAEMRAEVAARHGDGKPSSPGPGGSPSRVVERPSRPRTNSVILKELRESGSAMFRPQSPPSSPPAKPPPLPPRLSSLPKPTTEVQTSTPADLPVTPKASIQEVLTPINADATPPAVASPIHVVQPSSGARMMIPGIHASHRGEVMALGSPAPASPPPEVTRPTSIQSVYTLFKKAPPANPTDTTIQGALNSLEIPPRQIGNKSSQASLASTDSGVSTLPPPTPQNQVSAASEALKQLVAQDEAARSNPVLVEDMHKRRASVSSTHSSTDETNETSTDLTPSSPPSSQPPPLPERKVPPPLPPRRNTITTTTTDS